MCACPKYYPHTCPSCRPKPQRFAALRELAKDLILAYRMMTMSEEATTIFPYLPSAYSAKAEWRMTAGMVEELIRRDYPTYARLVIQACEKAARRLT